MAPVRLAAKVLSTTAEVASRTTQSVSALFVHNGSARLALTRHATLRSWLSGLVLLIALSEAGLASVAAVQVLVLDVVLGSCIDVSI